jgi:predicted nucleic acid-binding protein
LILFCDTSALVKLYIDEDSSDLVRDAVGAADAVAVSHIGWAEATAAFARRAREVPDDRPILEAAKAALAADWPRFVVLEVTQAVVERAGDYADVFALRAYDSVQLASAFEAGRIAETAVRFACFDARLNKASAMLGMNMLSSA